MKQLCVPSLLVVILAAGWCLGAGTDEPVRPVATGPLARVFHGGKNLVLSPVEIPATIRRVSEEKSVAFGLWAGLLEGWMPQLHRVVFYGDHVEGVRNLGTLMGFRIIEAM